MGLILHPQRRGIESLASHPGAVAPGFTDIDHITNAQIFDSNGEPLYAAGVSEGIGTCSDMLGTDVLVLTAQRPGQFYRTQNLQSGQVRLAYSVLVRSASEDELASDSLAQSGIARRAVELLAPQGFDQSGSAIFERTGHVALYTNLVT